MREIIKKLISVLYHYKQVIKWEREAKAEKKRIQYDCEISQKINGRCLILIPHSDDEWIGCSRVIQSGNEVVLCNMDMSGDDTNTLHKERYNEMKSVVDVHKRRLITIHQDKSENLTRAIEEYKPDYIFLPHFIDWHPEHREVMKLLRRALQKCSYQLPYVAMYQVSCPIVAKVTHALPMTKKDWKKKWSFFKKHYVTQNKIPYQRFALNEVINGQYISSYAAEVFCVLETNVWLSAFELNIVSEVQTSELKNYLGSISAMRNYIHSECDVRFI